MLLRTTVSIFAVLTVLSTVIITRQRVVLHADVATMKTIADVVKYTATADQVTLYRPDSTPEDSRIVASRTNTFLMDRQGCEKFSAEYIKKYGETPSISFELSCVPSMEVAGSAWYNCTVVKECEPKAR